MALGSTDLTTFEFRSGLFFVVLVLDGAKDGVKEGGETALISLSGGVVNLIVPDICPGGETAIGAGTISSTMFSRDPENTTGSLRLIGIGDSGVCCPGEEASSSPDLDWSRLIFFSNNFYASLQSQFGPKIEACHVPWRKARHEKEGKQQCRGVDFSSLENIVQLCAPPCKVPKSQPQLGYDNPQEPLAIFNPSTIPICATNPRFDPSLPVYLSP